MSEKVDHPSYYNRGKVEVIDFIEDWNLDFSMGCFVKYVCRAGHKSDAVEDLEKAKWYIKRYTEHPSEPEFDGTYDWREYAESQGLCRELCIAMQLAHDMYFTPDGLVLNDILFLIDTAIKDIKAKTFTPSVTFESGCKE